MTLLKTAMKLGFFLRYIKIAGTNFNTAKYFSLDNLMWNSDL